MSGCLLISLLPVWEKNPNVTMMLSTTTTATTSSLPLSPLVEYKKVTVATAFHARTHCTQNAVSRYRFRRERKSSHSFFHLLQDKKLGSCEHDLDMYEIVLTITEIDQRMERENDWFYFRIGFPVSFHLSFSPIKVWTVFIQGRTVKS